jgi:hypothetical protein
VALYFSQFLSTNQFVMKKNLLQMLVLAVLLFCGTGVIAQTPFSCTDGASYQLRGNPSALFTVNLRTGAATSLFNAATLGTRNLTGLGYNVADNFLYASVSGTNDIVRIGSDGTVTEIDVPSLTPAAYSAGDVTVIAGVPYLYLYVASATTMQIVNLNTLEVSSIILTQGANLADIAINAAGTVIYGISSNTGVLVTWPITGGAPTISQVGNANGAFIASTFLDSTGDLFLISDGSASVYEVSGPAFPNENSISRVTPNFGTPITNTDGARCVNSLATTQQPAFDCLPNQAFISTQNTLLSGDCSDAAGASTLLEYDLGSASIVNRSGQLIQSYQAPRTTINNLAYNRTDNYLWAYRFGTNQLVRIGSDRTVDFFAIPGLSNNCGSTGTINNNKFFSGDINADGVMHLLHGTQGDRIVRVDLNPSSPTYLTRLADVPLSLNPGNNTTADFQDMAFNPVDNLLYTVTSAGKLLRIDPVSGIVTDLGTVTGFPVPVAGFVVAYFDNSASLYVQAGSNNTNIYKIPNVANGNLVGSRFGSGASFVGGDGARCPLTAIAPELFTLSGNVFDDGNGLNDASGALVNTSGIGALNPVDGAVSLGTQLYVTLINADGNVLATVPVSSTGTYTFPDLAPGTYSTVLSTNSSGSTAANSPLPTDWDNTGEQLGFTPGATDGTVDGILTGIAITNANVINANFGINKKPLVVEGIDSSRPNPGGTIISPVTSTRFQGSDLEDGSYTTPADAANNNLKGRTVDLEPGANGDTYYNGVLVTSGDAPITSFDPALVSVDPAGTSNQDVVTTTFTYTVTDDAGVVSDPKTIQVPFTANPLPVTLISFNATKEGSSVNLTWATTEETNSDRFEIEFGTDGKVWNKIGTVASAGESRGLAEYSYQHNQPVAGQNLYRLKMVDKDLTFAYSAIRNVSLEGLIKNAVYPNPVTNGKLQLTDWTNVKALELYNQQGRKLQTFKPSDQDKMDVSKLADGLYVIKVIRANGTAESQSIIISR